MRPCKGKHGEVHDLDVVGQGKDGRCRACKAIYGSRYQASEKGREAHGRAVRRYDASEKGRLYYRHYWLFRGPIKRIQRRLGQKEALARELIEKLGS